jgi:hypothetical protein
MIGAIKVPFESFHMEGPEPAERHEPRIRSLNRFRFEPEVIALSIHRSSLSFAVNPASV